MLGSHRRISGAHRSRAGQILGSHLAYIRGAGQRTPRAVAVVAGEETLSYAELNVAANRLARVLRRRGIGANSRVAVCLERTVAMPVALRGRRGFTSLATSPLI